MEEVNYTKELSILAIKGRDLLDRIDKLKDPLYSPKNFLISKMKKSEQFAGVDSFHNIQIDDKEMQTEIEHFTLELLEKAYQKTNSEIFELVKTKAW